MKLKDFFRSYKLRAKNFWKRTSKSGPAKVALADVDRGQESPIKGDIVREAVTDTPDKDIPSDVDYEQESSDEEDIILDTTTADPKSLWDQAYEELRAEKPHVVEAYEALLIKVLSYQRKMPSITDLESLLSNPPSKAKTQDHGQRSLIDRKTMMEDIINLGKKYVDGKNITFKLGEQEFSLRDQIQPAVAGVQVGKAWIDEAVKASPLASAAWAGVSLLLPLLTNPAEMQAANEEGLAYVTQKIRYYTSMESLLLCEQDEKVLPASRKQLYEEHFVKLYHAIIDFQAQSVIRFFRRRFKNLLRDATKWDPWEEMLKNVKELGDNLEKESLHLNSISSSMSLAALTRWERESDEAKCLQCLDHGDYAWYKERVEDRVPDTCLWFLNHADYHSWLEADSGPLLVSADPGCGKSTLTKYLINSNFGFRVSKDVAICYFFFKEGDQNTIEMAFSSLVHQLLCLRPQLMHHALQKYKQFGATFANKTTVLWSILEAATADPKAGSVIIVLDALDECLQDERNMETLAWNIRKHFEQGPKALKILMTSRPYKNTVHEIQGLNPLYDANIRIRGEDASEIIRNETNLVIEHRIRRLGGEEFNDDLKKYLKERLLAISHRTYLWIHLVFLYLERSDIESTTKGLEDTIQNIPETVEDAYEKLLNRSKKPETTRKALLILLGAYRPLTISEMQIALKIDSDITFSEKLHLESDEAFYLHLRELCGIFITKHDEKLYFSHQTAREFLLTTSVPLLPISVPTPRWAHKFSLCQAHRVLFKSCVLYIDSLAFLASVESTTITPARANFVKYSGSYWYEHFREANIPDGAEITSSATSVSEPSSWSLQWLKDFEQRYRLDVPEEDLSSLALASAFGHTAVVQRLLLRGTLHGYRAAMPLMMAVRFGHEAVVKLLLAVDDIPVNFRLNGESPLRIAASNGNEAVVKLLLTANGINVNSRNQDGRTALIQAAGRGHEGVVKLLLAATGINVNLPDIFRCTPLMIAAGIGHEAVVAVLLAANGINVNSQNVTGGTALTEAVREGHEKVVKLLLATGRVDINTEDRDGWVPLHYAVQRGAGGIVKLLLETGQAIVNLKTKGGTSPLSIARRTGNKAIVELLQRETA